MRVNKWSPKTTAKMLSIWSPCDRLVAPANSLAWQQPTSLISAQHVTQNK